MRATAVLLALFTLAAPLLAATVTHDDAKTVSTIAAANVSVAMPYAFDWTVSSSPAAIVTALSEQRAMIASVSVDRWGEPIEEQAYLDGQLEALRAKFAVDDAAIDTTGAHPVLGYIMPITGGYQLNLWAVRQRPDTNVYRLHVSAVAEKRDALVAMRAKVAALLASGYVVSAP